MTDLPKLGLHLDTHHPAMKLSNYLVEPKAPPVVSRPHPDFSWGMLANDKMGDCVCAMMLHSIEDFHLDAGTTVPGFIDDDAILLYEKIGGYSPADPSSDVGCDEGVAMSTWEAGLPQTSDGVSHQIVGTVAVNPLNLDECRVAINEFVCLQLGVALPATAQGTKEWTVVGDGKTGDSAPGSWGGHGIPAREYDADTFKVVTWGAELLMTVPFWQAYVLEAHVVIAKEMLSNTGVSPCGVDWDALLLDMKSFSPVA